MRNAGIVLIIIGAIFMFVNGFSWIETREVADIGPIEINQSDREGVQWSPIVGVFLIATGAIVLVLGKK
jgi:hypothetical protein